ncbi:MAG: M20/M25/M40 family metallo-hydrolase [Desulfobacter sp.]|nr:M20/M25/M40 family metallo-hydrolase [Desulfobacter sp.]
MTILKNNLPPLGKSIYDLTLDLVGIQSVSRTKGERRIADHIQERLAKLDYFKQYPQQLISCPMGNTDQRNILALVRGKKDPSDQTLLYLGHMDTVDVKEYKTLEPLACDPDGLMKALEKCDLPDEVSEDLKSGRWLFGRGTADMKTGVAALICLLEKIAAAPDTFSGNIALCLVCDEEADSQGMISMAGPLEAMAVREHLNFVGAINTDVVTQMDGSSKDKRHMYLGAMGKAVPGVFVVGKAAHVGESLQGFDANMFLSRLTWLVDGNMALADHFNKEFTHPPVSLKQADLKTDYNGQVPFEAYAYYNILNYKRNVSQVMEIFQTLAGQAFEDCMTRLETQTRTFFDKNKTTPMPVNRSYRVMDFSQLCAHVREHKGAKVLDNAMDEICQSMGTYPELRDHSLALVQKVWHVSGLSGPAAIIFLMPPYYPANDPEFEDPKFKWFNQKTLAALTPYLGRTQKTPYDIRLDRFFPFLSDASFCAYTEGRENKAVLEENMPCWERGWAIDIEKIRRLNIPVLDMGVHGKDFHKLYERVHVPYSMETLPGLIQAVTLELLNPAQEDLDTL